MPRSLSSRSLTAPMTPNLPIGPGRHQRRLRPRQRATVVGQPGHWLPAAVRADHRKTMRQCGVGCRRCQLELRRASAGECAVPKARPRVSKGLLAAGFGTAKAASTEFGHLRPHLLVDVGRVQVGVVSLDHLGALEPHLAGEDGERETVHHSMARMRVSQRVETDR